MSFLFLTLKFVALKKLELIKMLTLPKIKEHLKRICPEFETRKFLLAVSGGADSMVLANLVADANLTFEIAHVNYHLRAEDSNRDQKIVEDFCKRHQVPFHLYDVSEKDHYPENSIELWARNLRYQFFFKTLKDENLDFIVMAHHLNDQLETFLINLSRASGISGLSGIPENENRILRPLLHFTKQEIYDFAKESKIKFGEDYTNHEEHYLRNRIRHHITPQLEKTNERFWANFDQSLKHLSAANRFIKSQIQTIFEDLTLKKNDQLLVLNKSKLAKESDLVRYQILKSLGFTNVLENRKIFKAENGSVFKGQSFILTIGRDELIFDADESPISEPEEIQLPIDKKITFPQIMLISEKDEPNWNHQWAINLSKVKFPLKLRKPRVGEFFYPAGMNGKKLISKFFRDERIPIFARNDAWVFSDAEDHVLGILGYRQDARFKAEKNDQKIYLYL